MTAAVAILNWNGKEVLEQFLPSVLKHTDPSVGIYVIDNQSTDDSVAFVKEHFPSIKIVVNTSNHGYAGGYNRGLKEIQADYFILLNSDVAVTSNWLTPLVETLRKDPKIAACQPKILSFTQKDEFEYAGAAGGFIDRDGFPFCRGRIFDAYEKDEGQYDNEVEVFWASGACLCIKSDLFWEQGGFDEDFYAHMEEIDLCWRLKNTGHKIVYCPRSKIYHLGGGTLAMHSPKKTFFNFRNNLFLLVKNYRRGSLFTKLFFRLFLDGLATVKFFFEGHIKHAFAVLHAHVEFYLKLFYFLKKRNALKKGINNPNGLGIYARSIVWAFFIHKKKSFKSLNIQPQNSY